MPHTSTGRGILLQACRHQQRVVRQAAPRSRHQPLHTSRPLQQSVLSLLEERGYVNQIAGDRDRLDRLLDTRKVGFYAGVDPTASSLHLGHLLPFMVLFWLYHRGHHVVSLVGGATAQVGDPSGRLTSRATTADAAIQSNFESMFAQMGGLWENVIRYGKRHGQDRKGVGTQEVLNNAQWLDNLNILFFLKTLGNGARLGAMLGRETVKNKMERGDGMSYSEFTYPLLQAWDWWHMFQDRAVQIQIGGGDQYGNIIAGIDAVKHIAQAHAPAEHRTAWLDAEGRLKDDVSPMGLTVPLLTTSTGEKFGKTAGNAIWLDPTMTTPFDLYGFLLRSSDADVERYLHLFTFVPAPEIAAVMAQHRQDPGKRPAQHLLAAEVLELVHGVDVAARTRAEHQRLRAPSLASLATPPVDASAPAAAAADAVLRTRLPRSLVEGTPVARILYHAGLVESKSEGARMVGKGGVYVATAAAEGPCGGERTTLSFSSVKDVKADEVQGLVQDGLLVLRLGKWKVRVIEVVDDDDFDSAGGEAPGWTAYKEARGER